MQIYKNRIASIDFLRGLSLVLLIFVNNPGSWDYVYKILDESAWSGLTPADCVFPTFIFLVGVSVMIALSKRVANGWTSWHLIRKIAVRAVFLFAIGVLIHAYPYFDWSTVRIPGVLQRIALVYLISSFIFLYVRQWQWQSVIAAGILVGYWLLLTYVPVPGIGHPSFMQGQNLSAWLDNFLLKGHLWHQAKTWDPEGILSTLPAIATGILGLLTGKILLDKNKSEKDKVIYCAILGSILILFGLFWSHLFPINKKLWSSSFVLVVGGIDVLTISIGYWLFDIRKVSNKWISLVAVLGANTLFLYVIEELVGATLVFVPMPFYQPQTPIGSWIFEHIYLSWLPGKLASFSQSLTLAVLLIGLFYLLSKKRWVINL